MFVIWFYVSISLTSGSEFQGASQIQGKLPFHSIIVVLRSCHITLWADIGTYSNKSLFLLLINIICVYVVYKQCNSHTYTHTGEVTLHPRNLEFIS